MLFSFWLTLCHQFHNLQGGYITILQIGPLCVLFSQQHQAFSLHDTAAAMLPALIEHSPALIPLPPSMLLKHGRGLFYKKFPIYHR